MNVYEQLTRLRDEAAAMLAAYDFSHVAFNYVRLDTYGNVLVLEFYVQDDFQKKVDFNSRVGVGTIEVRYSDSGRTTSPARLMGRAERELRVLAQTNATVIDMRDAFASAAAQDFLARLTAQNAELGGLLVDLSGGAK